MKTSRLQVVEEVWVLYGQTIEKPSSFRAGERCRAQIAQATSYNTSASFLPKGTRHVRCLSLRTQEHGGREQSGIVSGEYVDHTQCGKAAQ